MIRCPALPNIRRHGVNLLFGAQSSDIPDPRGSLHRTAAYTFAVPYPKARDLLNPKLLNAGIPL